MKPTRMSGIASMSAGVMLAILCSGCASTGRSPFAGWGGKRSTAAEASAQSAGTPYGAAPPGQQAAQQYPPVSAPSQLPPTYSAAGMVGGGMPSAGPASNTVAGAASSTSNSFQSPSGGQYGGQKTCPVTGQPLGSMGAPVPVTWNGETIYLCCEGCVAKFQTSPGVYIDLVNYERNPGRGRTNTHSTRSSGGCSSGGCSSGGCSRCGR